MEADHKCRFFQFLSIRYITIFLCFCFITNAVVIRDLIMQTEDSWINITDLPKTQKETTHCNISTVLFRLIFIPMPKLKTISMTKATYEKINQIIFMGHLSTELVSGYFADKRGSRRNLLIYGFVTSFLVCIGTLLIHVTSGNTVVILVWRILLGMTMGLVYPSVTSIVANWTPKHRRSTVVGVICSTLATGTILSRTIVKLLVVGTGYWQFPFYTWGVMVLACSIFWYFLGYSSPYTHPFIGHKEKMFLHESLGKSIVPFNQKRVPWSKIFTSVPVWASIINHMGKGCLFYTLYFYTADFFLTALGINLFSNLFMGQMMIFGLWGGSTVLSGVLCDFLVNMGVMDVTTTRKIFSNFGAVGATIFLVDISWMGCRQMQGYILYLFLILFYSMYDIGVSSNDIDLSPNYAATLKGITETGEYIFTFTTPIMLKKMSKNQTIQGWRIMFLAIMGVVMTSNVIFSLFGKAKEQPWNQSQAVETNK